MPKTSKKRKRKPVSKSGRESTVKPRGYETPIKFNLTDALLGINPNDDIASRRQALMDAEGEIANPCFDIYPKKIANRANGSTGDLEITVERIADGVDIESGYFRFIVAAIIIICGLAALVAVLGHYH